MNANTIDPRDLEWVRSRFGRQFDEDGICFAVWNGETFGPFACKAEANAALDRKLAELTAQGVDIVAASPEMSVIFADPAVYHLPTGAAANG